MATTTWDVKQPDQLDFLRPNGFYFLIQNLPGVTYFCQSANIPSVNLGYTTQVTPFIDVALPGEKLQYGELTIKFMIQENLNNYIELYNWMIALGFPENYGQFQSRFGGNNVITPSGSTSEKPPARKTDSTEFSDATLLVLDSNYAPVSEFVFRDCFPVSLTGLEFDVSSGNTQYFAAQATFKYRVFNVNALT